MPGGRKQLLSPILQRAVDLKPGECYSLQGNALFSEHGRKKHTTCEIVAVNYMWLTGQWQHTSPSNYNSFTVVQFHYQHKLN